VCEDGKIPPLAAEQVTVCEDDMIPPPVAQHVDVSLKEQVTVCEDGTIPPPAAEVLVDAFQTEKFIEDDFNFFPILDEGEDGTPNERTLCMEVCI
jgi:hypothetical protein